LVDSLVGRAAEIGVKWTPLIASFSDKLGNKLIAWWLPWNAQEYLPKLATVKISLEGIEFKDPVLIDPLDGEVYNLENFSNETNMLLHNIQENDNNFSNMEFHTTFKKQIIIV
jgi:hypothetical protein